MKYELRVSNEPDALGHYLANVYGDDRYITTKADVDRAAAIAKAREYVAWHKAHDESEEVIEL